jgi:hypothetical protein
MDALMLARWLSIWRPLALAIVSLAASSAAHAQGSPATGYDSGGDVYRPGGSYGGGYPPGGNNTYRPNAAPYDVYRPNGPYNPSPGRDAYVPPPPGGAGGAPGYDGAPRYSADPAYGDGSRPPPYGGYQGAEPYDRNYGGPPPPPAYGEGPPPPGYGNPDRTYSRNEILDAGNQFFGSVSQGLANVVEYTFQQAGRPNGYILGEDAGGAFFAGLRYGEGTLYTKDAGLHKVYWQGPSIGYDFGGAGSKTMVLVYNLRDPYEIYNRFGGVEGSAYIVGGVSVQFEKNGEVTLAPIRSGVGLRLGANIGYLKYTRSPTWNPF